MNLHWTSTYIDTGTDVPMMLLAEQLYVPVLFLCILKIVYIGVLLITFLVLFELYHVHSILVFGLAAISTQSSVMFCPTLAL